MMKSEDQSSDEPRREAMLHGVEGLDPAELFARGLHSLGAASAQTAWVPPAPAEVARLLPQYGIESLLGHGGMGAVYKGRQPNLDRPVAIKLLSPEIATDPDFIARFHREARILARLQHPGIVGIYDFGQTAEGHPYFVMEFVEGTDLHCILGGPGLTPEQALHLISQVCEALHYAHSRGVIHRDIKPGNIMVARSGAVKLADFGLARPFTEENADLTDRNIVMGTADYMAPEQRDGSGNKGDQRGDIYALGVMLYEMLTGQRPRGAFTLPSDRVQVDVRLDQVVLKALQQAPERRYQQVSEMKTDVDQIRTTPGPAASAAVTGSRPGGQRMQWAIAAVLLIAALAGGWWWKMPTSGRPAPVRWRSVISTNFDESSPFQLTAAPTWTSALKGGRFTVLRTDSGSLWLGAHDSEAGTATRLETEARIASDGIFAARAATAHWGILFRRTEQGHYALFIRGDGSWRLSLRGRREETISRWKFSPALRKAGEFNKIRVDAIGSRVSIQANGTVLGEFECPTLSSGSQELYFASSGDAFFEFENFQLSEGLPSSAGLDHEL